MNYIQFLIYVHFIFVQQPSFHLFKTLTYFSIYIGCYSHYYTLMFIHVFKEYASCFLHVPIQPNSKHGFNNLMKADEWIQYRNYNFIGEKVKSGSTKEMKLMVPVWKKQQKWGMPLFIWHYFPQISVLGTSDIVIAIRKLCSLAKTNKEKDKWR